jgi:hypothetical protein
MVRPFFIPKILKLVQNMTLMLSNLNWYISYEALICEEITQAHFS